jgi:guanine nucleotide-binding protein subunit beta-2-like 1 protein
MSSSFSIEPIGVLEGHGGAVTSLVCGENSDGSPLLFSGSRDKTIIQWELNFEGKVVTYIDEEDEGKKKEKTLVGKPLHSFHGHNHFVSSLALNSDSTKLISGSWDKTLRLWDVATCKKDTIFKGHTKDVLCVGFSHDERLIFSGGMDNVLKYWNTRGEFKHDNSQFKGWVSCILNIDKVDENEKKHYIAVGCWDGTVKILNSEYNIEREIPGEEYAVTSLSSDEDGFFLFIAYKNGTVKVVTIQGDPDQNEVKQTIETGIDINTILFESSFFEIFAIGNSKGLQIRKVKAKDEKDKKPVFEDNMGACLSLCYDKSKSYLFAGFSNGVIKVYKTANIGGES